MQGSCCLGPGLVQPAGSGQDTLDLSSIRCLSCVASVLLVAWEESSLRGQVGVVSRSCSPHTQDSSSPFPIQDQASRAELQQPSS